MISPDDFKHHGLVIAHVRPFQTWFWLFPFAAMTFVLLKDLLQNGWLNPYALAVENPMTWNTRLISHPYVGQIVAVFSVGLLLLALANSVWSTLNRFKDVVFDGRRLFWISHPWLGKIPLDAIVSARTIEPRKSPFKNRVDRIEIGFLRNVRGRRAFATALIDPTLCRESLEQIIDNLASCGISVELRDAS